MIELILKGIFWIDIILGFLVMVIYIINIIAFHDLDYKKRLDDGNT